MQLLANSGKEKNLSHLDPSQAVCGLLTGLRLLLSPLQEPNFEMQGKALVGLQGEERGWCTGICNIKGWGE